MVPLLLLSDQVLLAIVAGVPATLAATAALVVGIRTSRRTEEIAITGAKTHGLVNSSMGVQLRMNAAVTRRMAALTGEGADEAAAAAAELLLREHEEKQARVDEKEALAELRMSGG